MEISKKRILKAKWFERLGLLATGSLAFQGLLVEGGPSTTAIILGIIFAVLFYGIAFYLLKKS